MKAKWGMMVVDGRGKLGGHVLSKNRSGSYARTKVTPVNPQTSFQLAVRNRLTTFSQGWKALTQVQIAAWNNAVSNFASSNIFGDTVSKTGKNLYTGLNQNLASIAAAAITSPPVPVGGGAVVAGVAIVASAGVKSIAHTGSVAGRTVQVWATPGVSAGKSNVKNNFRLIGTFAGAAASPFVATTAYDARFGTQPVGSYVSFRLVSINATTGEAGTPSTSRVIVT